MKKNLIIGLMLLCASICPAQDIIQMRYYFNSNAENLHLVNVASTQELDENFEIDLTGLSQGVHTLYIDLLNNEGKWTHYDRVLVQVIGGAQMFTLNSFEYFYDLDPGFGNGIQVAMSGESFTGDLPLSIEGLSEGVHYVYCRFKDGENQWTHYHKQLIQITKGGIEDVIRAEYFFDTDPGYGNGNVINFDATPTLDLEYALMVPTDLAWGEHIMFVRILDSSGQWSHYGQDTLLVCDIETPTITMEGDLCPGETVTLYANEGYNSYLWSNGSDADSTNVNESGNYTLYVTDDDCAISIETSVEFVEIPFPIITANGNILSVEGGKYNYQWSLNGNVIPNNNTSIFEATESGTVQVTVTAGECTITSDPFDFAYDYIQSMNQKSFSMYPNPSDGMVHVKTTQNGHIQLYDTKGILVLSQQISEGDQMLDLRNLSDHLYLVKVIQGAETHTTRLLLNH